MPRKRKKKPSDSSTEATLRQLQTQLTDPRITQWLWSGARGVRERIMRIDYNVLRSVVDKVPIINGIINTRIAIRTNNVTFAAVAACMMAPPLLKLDRFKMDYGARLIGPIATSILHTGEREIHWGSRWLLWLTIPS